MPAIYSAYALRQFAPVPKVIGEPLPVILKERDQRLTVLWATDATGEEIAHDLGFASANGVYDAAKRLRLPARKLRYEERTSGAAADAVIRDLWPTKIKLKDIAARLNWRHGQSVSKRARELGLPNRRTGQSRLNTDQEGPSV